MKLPSHLQSQKFAGFIFGVFVCFLAGVLLAEAVAGTVIMGVCALYGAFVGGRAYSDAQALKATKRTPPKDDEQEGS